MSSRAAQKLPKDTITSTREQILDALVRWCSEAGRQAHDLTLSALAELAGVSRMTLYRHFASKEILLTCAEAERGIALEEEPLGTRERILEAARVVFVAEGFGATMESIASQAGVGIATVYRQFGDKENLLEAFRDWMRPSEAFVTLELSLSEDVESDLATFASHMLERMSQSKDILILAIRDRLDGTESPRLTGPSGVSFKRLARYFTRQIEAGRLAADLSPKDLATAFMGSLAALALLAPTLTGEAMSPAEELGVTVARIFVRGTLPTKGEDNAQ